jgi:outer membrane protein OmpA-like peptidoglycan-associated protein
MFIKQKQVAREGTMPQLCKAVIAGCLVAAGVVCSPVISSSGGAAVEQRTASDTSVFFPSGSAALTPEAEAVVSTTAEKARVANPTAVLVTGHTNAAEGQEADRELAGQRAAAVGRALVAQGVPGQKVQTSADPATAATTDIRDRRVDVQVIGQSLRRP